MAKDHLLALDQGTSSSRAIVFHRDGHIVAMAQREFRQIYPQPGWVEHDADEIWSTQLDTARQALAASGLQAGDIAAIGITNQRETTLLWNRRTGRPLHNAIVWQDRRTAAFCEQLRAQGLEALKLSLVGNLLYYLCLAAAIQRAGGPLPTRDSFSASSQSARDSCDRRPQSSQASGSAIRPKAR